MKMKKRRRRKKIAKMMRTRIAISKNRYCFFKNF
jgi:hypothetical protein